MGRLSCGLGTAMLLIGALVNVFLVPIVVVGVVSGMRGCHAWDRSDDETVLWTGVALLCSTAILGFALASGVPAWVSWAGATSLLVLVGWVGAKHQAARLHRNWALQRRLRGDATPWNSDHGRPRGDA